LLCPEERQVLRELRRPDVREVQTGARALRIAYLEWVLRCEQRVAGGASRENLAGVVHGFAPCPAGGDVQLLEQVVGPELRLQAVIGGKGSVGALTVYTETAGHATHVATRAVCRPTTLRGGRATAGRGSRRQQIRERLCQARRGSRTEVRIAVDRLEAVHRVVAQVPRLKYRILRDLALEPEGVGMHFVGSKVRGDVGLVLGARIERIGGNERS